MDERKKTRKQRTSAKRQKARRKKRNRVLKILGVLLLLCIIVAGIGGALLWTKYGPSDEKADLNEYYGISNDEVAIILNNAVLGSGGRMVDGIPYIEYSILRSSINNRIYWDSNEHLLLYSLPDETITVEAGSKGSEDYVIFTEEGETAYVALPFVQKYTNIEYRAYEDPNRVVVVSEWGEVTRAAIQKKHPSVTGQA